MPASSALFRVPRWTISDRAARRRTTRIRAISTRQTEHPGGGRSDGSWPAKAIVAVVADGVDAAVSPRMEAVA
jgi:hypothetical protein